MLRAGFAQGLRGPHGITLLLEIVLIQVVISARCRANCLDAVRERRHAVPERWLAVRIRDIFTDTSIVCFLLLFPGDSHRKVIFFMIR
jgi:hypothetical protein